MLTLAVKPQWVCYKLDETNEQPCSDFLAHTMEVCKSACQYNHESWGTCITSVKCKTVITTVLRVISGMDPHMISGNLGWVFLLSHSWVVSKWILLGCGLVTIRLCDAIEPSSLRSRVHYSFATMVKA
jgi:hypothetical protein